MKQRNVLLVFILILGNYSINANETEPSDGKSQDQKDRTAKSKFSFIIWLVTIYSIFQWQIPHDLKNCTGWNFLHLIRGWKEAIHPIVITGVAFKSLLILKAICCELVVI